MHSFKLANLKNKVLQLTIFDETTEKNILSEIFLTTNLGKYYSSLPLEELSNLLPKRSCNQKGVKGWLTNKGKIALQFLKPYLNISDEKLLARLNSDWQLQYFCGIRLSIGERIRDKNLI